jgi:Zn finger protein HypA/HybF involved in hydrogenase expression
MKKEEMNFSINWYGSSLLLKEQVIYIRCWECDSVKDLIKVKPFGEFSCYICQSCYDKSIHLHQSDDHISQA